MKTILLFFFFTLMISGIIYGQTPKIETGVSQELARWRKANYSDVRYKLNITLEKGAPLMKGTIEVSVNVSVPPASAGGSTPAIILDWRKIKDKENLSTVSNVFLNDKSATLAPPADAGGTDLRYEERNEHLIFTEGVKTGENVIKLDFTSPIATSGAAVTRYVDKEDNAEYVYSLFVPSDASTAFPVFDQPDLKAKFQLNVRTSSLDWKVISNTNASKHKYNFGRGLGNSEELTGNTFVFEETKPISTYVFAFAAGEFAVFDDKSNSNASRESGEKKVARRETSGTNVKTNFSTGGATENISRISDAPSSDTNNTRRFTSGYFLGAPSARKPVDETENISSQKSGNLSTKIYVRKSQAEKFKQHADEVFRLNRESVKYLEDWFDYKFPFPKYDLVLIPEFPFGGMEHAGATFLREDRVIFPTEPTKNDFITRANLIFHEAAHQWFGDTVTMKWFDDLWLKEGFAEFMAYKTLEKVLPEYNAWKVFYERNKQAAYLTDVTRGTTPIYQEIPNLSSAKSAYGNIVYRKAPSFLKQAEFYLGTDKFQMAVRQFLKKHEFANAEWADLIKEFETAIETGEQTSFGKKENLREWADYWVKRRGLPIVRIVRFQPENSKSYSIKVQAENSLETNVEPRMLFFIYSKEYYRDSKTTFGWELPSRIPKGFITPFFNSEPYLIFPNYQDYGYGIFLLDEKSRAYVLENIGAEKDDFLRSMMWGSLWDSVRFYELAPEDYVKLVIKNINVETDESTIQSLLGRVSTAMNYYIKSAGGSQSVPPALAGGSTRQIKTSEKNQTSAKSKLEPSAYADDTDLQTALEKLLINKIETAPTVGQKITYFRALQSIGSSEQTKQIFKDLLTGKSKMKNVELKTKDKFDLVTRLIILGDKDALDILAKIEKEETDDAAKRYAYAARAGIPTKENKAKYWNDFVNNKEISENWIESAFAFFNTPRHSELTLPYLEKALAELPNLKRNRKIFFVNGWLGAFIGGQKSEEALKIVNDFLEKNPNLDRDLQKRVLEYSDGLERAVYIQKKYRKLKTKAVGSF